MILVYIGNAIGKEAEQLTHHGIKGQKWGVRRYQNADGSLTAAGRQRYRHGYGDMPDDRDIISASTGENTTSSKDLSKTLERINKVDETLQDNLTLLEKEAKKQINLFTKNGMDKDPKYMVAIKELHAVILQYKKEIKSAQLAISDYRDAIHKSLKELDDGRMLGPKYSESEAFNEIAKKYVDTVEQDDHWSDYKYTNLKNQNINSALNALYKQATGKTGIFYY